MLTKQLTRLRWHRVRQWWLWVMGTAGLLAVLAAKQIGAERIIAWIKISFTSFNETNLDVNDEISSL